MDEETLLGIVLIGGAFFFFWCSMLTIAIVLAYTTDWDSKIGERQPRNRRYSGNNKRLP